MNGDTSGIYEKLNTSGYIIFGGTPPECNFYRVNDVEPLDGMGYPFKEIDICRGKWCVGFHGVDGMNHMNRIHHQYPASILQIPYIPIHEILNTDRQRQDIYYPS